MKWKLGCISYWIIYSIINLQFKFVFLIYFQWKSYIKFNNISYFLGDFMVKNNIYETVIIHVLPVNHLLSKTFQPALL